MFFPLPIPQDGLVHDFCHNCFTEDINAWDSKSMIYKCNKCGFISNRRIHFDPERKAWKNSENELCHESVGIFIVNPHNQVFMFERLRFPFGLTIPAGHMIIGETALKAGIMEMMEETNIFSDALIQTAETLIENDSCIYGADSHYWHIFKHCISEEKYEKIDVRYEGENAVWLNIDEALQSDLIPAVRKIIEKYGVSLFEFEAKV